MLTTKARFERKLSALEAQDCVIEAIEVMSNEKYNNFTNSLLTDRQFISDRKEDMFTDSSGQIHCILALNEESGDGVIINSSGYDYARYVSFTPNIKPYIEQQIELLADQIIRYAAENTSNGSWIIDFEEISEQYGITVKENNGIGSMLLSELESRKEMVEIVADNGCFDMVLYLDYCNNLDESSMEKNIKM
ncbi:hypothetical protein DSECCO2_503510 [anaerobic digester metagenome]